MLDILVGGAGVIDSSLVTELVALIKSAMGLFSEFPLNVLLIASLVGVAFTVYTSAAGAVKN